MHPYGLLAHVRRRAPQPDALLIAEGSLNSLIIHQPRLVRCWEQAVVQMPRAQNALGDWSDEFGMAPQGDLHTLSYVHLLSCQVRSQQMYIEQRRSLAAASERRIISLLLAQRGHFVDLE